MGSTAASSAVGDGGARAGWAAVAILGIAYIFSYMDRQILTLLIEPIRVDLGISDTQISLLTGLAFAICYSGAALPMGHVADKHNRRNLIMAGVAVWSLMTAACGLAQNFIQLFLARMGVGLGEATLPPAAYSLIADRFPPHRLPLALSLFVIGAPLGGGAALIAGGGLIDWVSSWGRFSVAGLTIRPWQIAFLTIGASGLFVCLLLSLVREPSRSRAAKADETSDMAGPLLYMKRHRRLFTLMLAALSIGNMFNYGYMAWLPTIFVREHGWTLAQTGSTIGLLMIIAGCAGTLGGGALASALVARGRQDACLRSIILGNLILIPASTLLPIMGEGMAAMACAGIAIFGIFLNAGVFPTLLQLITPPDMRGRISAFSLLIVNLSGLGLGPTVYALTSDYGFGGRPGDLSRALSSMSAFLLLLCSAGLILSLPTYRRAAAETARRQAA